MRKTKKTLAILAIVAMVVAMIPVQVFADTTSSAMPARLAGTTQYDTAVAIANQAYPNGSDAVVLAPGEKANLVDALAAGPLAAALNAPILLTDGKTLTADTKAILDKAKNVYVVSGNKVITDAVRSQLTGIVDVFGAEAPDTSVAIAKAIAAVKPFTKVVLANVGGQDALSVASFAAASNMPILITNGKDGLPDSVKTYLASLSGVTSSYVIGGAAVISDAEMAQLPSATRIAGNTAYDTNKEVISKLATSFNNVFIANGETMVDALAGAPLAASKNAPIVLTDGTTAVAGSLIPKTAVVTALGGNAVVPQTVVDNLNASPAVSSVSAINSTIGIGGQTGFQFKDVNGTVISATGATYALADASYGSIDASTGMFTAAKAGTVTVNATYQGQQYSATVTVFGAAAQVNMKVANDSISDNATKQAIGVTVVDANGNTVQNYNGNLTVQMDNNTNASIVDQYGATKIGVAPAANGPTTITITNGVGSIYILPIANRAGLNNTITASALSSTNGQANAAFVNYPSYKFNYVQANGSTLSLSANTPNVAPGGNDVVTIKIKDGQGTTLGALPTTQYITLSLSGPGSFSQVASAADVATTTSTIAMTTGQTTVTVYALSGQTGTITVSAAAAGLTTGTVSIACVNAGVPNTYTFTAASSTDSVDATEAGRAGMAAAGMTAGTVFTVYTVQFTDANGNAVAPPVGDTVTITDNSQAPSSPGTLVYMAYSSSAIQGTLSTGGAVTASNGAISGSGTTNTTTLTTAAFSNGKFQFAVANKGTNATNPTLTVQDSTLSVTQSLVYPYFTGSASLVKLSTDEQNFSVTQGTTNNITFQLADAFNNSLSLANQVVYVWFHQAAAAPAGVTFGTNGPAPQANQATAPAGAFQVATDANGVATVPITATGTAALGTFTIGAAISGQAADQTITGEIVGASNAVSGLDLTNAAPVGGAAPTGVITVPSSVTITSGSALTAVNLGAAAGPLTIAGVNPINQSIKGMTAGDQIVVKSSDKTIATIGAPNTSKQTVTLAATGVALPSITGVSAGTATITITDKSAENTPSITFNVTVTPASYSTNAYIMFNGTRVSASNPVTVAANTPVALTIQNVDAAGNAVPVTLAESNDYGQNAIFALADTVTPANGSFRLTSGGAGITSVKIPVGQTSTTFYYVNSNAVTVNTTGYLTGTLQASGVTLNAGVTTTPYGAAAPGTTGVATLVVGGAVAGAAGTVTVSIDGANAKNINVGLGDALQATADAIVAAYAGNATYAVDDAAGASTTVTFTQIANATAPMVISVNPGAVTATTFTPGAPTAGIAPTLVQAMVQTLTVTAGATNAGTIYVTMTDDVAGTPMNQTVSVNVTAGESAANVATAIANAFAANATVTGRYTVTNPGAGLVRFTQVAPTAAVTINFAIVG